MSKFERKSKASKFKGVYKCGRKWKSQIQADGVQHYLGVFDSEDAAASMYSQVSNRLLTSKFENISVEEAEPFKKSTVQHLKLINQFAHKNSMSLVESPPIVEVEKEETEIENEVLQLKLKLGRVIRTLTLLNQELMGASPNTTLHTSLSTEMTTGSQSSTSSITECTLPIESQILSLLAEQSQLTDRIFELMELQNNNSIEV